MSKRLAVIVLLLAGVLALAASTQPWVFAQLEQVATSQSEITATGKEANAALAPISLAVLALGIALTIAGQIFRYVLSIISVLLGAGLIWVGISSLADPIAAVSTQLSELTGLTGGAQFDSVENLSSTPWPYVTILTGVVTIIAGLIVVLRSRNWKTGGRKYETDKAPVSAEPDRVSDWDMLSNGEDPSENLP